MTYQNILTEIDGGVGIITLNRADRHNAFDDVTILELIEALGAMGADPAVRVVTAMPTDPAPLVVAPADLKLALGDRYSGQNFTLLERWQPASAGAWAAQARWLLYREAKSAPSQTWDVVLWADRKTSGAAGQSNGAVAPTAPAVPASGNQSQ
jgi:hypothetical protein